MLVNRDCIKKYAKEGRELILCSSYFLGISEHCGSKNLKSEKLVSIAVQIFLIGFLREEKRPVVYGCDKLLFRHFKGLSLEFIFYIYYSSNYKL